MPNTNKKKIIKEAFGEQGLTTPQVFNRVTDSDIEKVIKGVLKKSFSEYTLEAYRHQGETEYINLNLCKEEFDVDIKNFEQFERFRIATELAEFRQQYFTELSKYLNVVNIKVGPYDYVKGSGYIKFNVTILMSDNNISDWVSGIRKKTESKKKFVSENLDYEKRLGALAKRKGLAYEEILDDKRYDDLFHKEAKVAKAFSTGDKDEFEVKNKLIKKGLDVSVIKDKEVKVKWDDKKHSEEGIKQLIGEKKENSAIKTILESLYTSTLQEARPRKEQPKQTNKQVSSKPKFVPKTKELDKRTEASLQKTIREYNSLSQEIEELQEKFQKSIQRKVDKVGSLESKIFDMMQSVDINLFVVDQIVAKLSTPYTRTNTKYKEVVEEILKKVNEETKKMIEKLLKSKKFKTETDIESQLSVVDNSDRPVRKTRKTESKQIQLAEGILNWFKSLFSSFKSYLNTLTSARKQLQSVAKEMGI